LGAIIPLRQDQLKPAGDAPLKTRLVFVNVLPRGREMNKPIWHVRDEVTYAPIRLKTGMRLRIRATQIRKGYIQNLLCYFLHCYHTFVSI